MASINNGMCRCCASEGTFKDLKSKYHWMGEEEIYAEMLKECFDVELTEADDGNDGGICEVCITQLRNASNFKKQVLHTEEQFKKHLENRPLHNIVKVEVTAEDNDSDNDNDNNLSEEFSGAGEEYEVPIKTEDEADEPKPKKRAAKASTSRAKKAKADEGESSSRQLPCNVCTMTFSTQFNLKRHMLQQHNELSNYTTKKLCEGCGKMFFNDEWLKKHLAVGCPMADTRRCVECELEFESRTDMYVHMRRMHWVEYRLLKYNCPLCPATLQSHEEHDSHLCSVHEVETDFQELQFVCQEELAQWIHEMETEQNVCYLKRTSPSGGIYYHCYPVKYLGSSRVYGRVTVCPSRIDVSESDHTGLITAMYQTTHVCHNNVSKEEPSVYCPVCKLPLIGYDGLDTHLKDVHLVFVHKKEETFSSFNDFLKWKSKMQTETEQYFKRHSMTIPQQGNVLSKSYYSCTQTKPWTKSRISCPARLVLTWNVGKDVYHLEYQTTHAGHDSVYHPKLTTKERETLAERIINGESLNEIINDCRCNANNHTKLKYLQKWDLYNLIRDFKIDKQLVKYDRLKSTTLMTDQAEVGNEVESISITASAVNETVDFVDEMIDLNEANVTEVTDLTEVTETPKANIVIENFEPELDVSKCTNFYIVKLKKNLS